jgi:hypothetical protein
MTKAVQKAPHFSYFFPEGPQKKFYQNSIHHSEIFTPNLATKGHNFKTFLKNW